MLVSLRNGATHILKDGSLRALWSESGVEFVAGFLDTTGDPVLLGIDSSGDLIRKTCNHFLGPSTAAGSVVFNNTHPMVNPVVLQDGSQTHIWYGYDVLGSTAYTVFHSVSTDDGATWAAHAEVIALGSGGTWNDVAVVPWGVYKDTTASKYYVHCIGNDGAIWTLGRFSLDTIDDLNDPLDYDEHGSNPVFPNSGGTSQYGSVLYAEGKYHLWHGGDATPGSVFYKQSDDGLVWRGTTTHPIGATEGDMILRIGSEGGLDDTQIRTTGAAFWDGHYYLFYAGNDSANWWPMVAVGETPRALYKVGGLANLNDNAPTTYDAAEVYYATGDLRFTMGDPWTHVLDRGKPGAPIENGHAPASGSFSFRHFAIGTGGVAAAGTSPDVNLWEYMFLADPKINEGRTVSPVASEPATVHVLQNQKDGADALEGFYLFLNCVFDIELGEQQDGNLVRANFTSHGGSLAVHGRY